MCRPNVSLPPFGPWRCPEKTPVVGTDNPRCPPTAGAFVSSTCHSEDDCAASPVDSGAGVDAFCEDRSSTAACMGGQRVRFPSGRLHTLSSRLSPQGHVRGPPPQLILTSSRSVPGSPEAWSTVRDGKHRCKSEHRQQSRARPAAAPSRAARAQVANDVISLVKHGSCHGGKEGGVQ